jgi:hypothetical protein
MANEGLLLVYEETMIVKIVTWWLLLANSEVHGTARSYIGRQTYFKHLQLHCVCVAYLCVCVLRVKNLVLPDILTNCRNKRETQIYYMPVLTTRQKNSFLFFRCVAKLRKANISFVMSVCSSAWNNSAPTGRIFMKFGIWVFFEDLSRKFQV